MGTRRAFLTTGIASFGSVALTQSITSTSSGDGLELEHGSVQNRIGQLRIFLQNHHGESAIVDAVTVPSISGPAAFVDGVGMGPLHRTIVTRAVHLHSTDGYHEGRITFGKPASLRDDGRQASVPGGHIDMTLEIDYFMDKDGVPVDLTGETFEEVFLIEYHLPSDGEERARKLRFELPEIEGYFARGGLARLDSDDDNGSIGSGYEF